MLEKTISISKSELFSLERVLPVLAFTIPFFISGPQLLTGTIVNCLLFLSTKYTSKKTSIIIALVPSIGALLNGLVFGKFTPFLAYFIPVIWIGNLILIRVFSVILGIPPLAGDSRIDSGRAPLARMTMAIIISAALKSLFLFLFSFIFFKLQIVPQIFLTAMGVFQFITAMLGGAVFLGINKAIKN